MPIQINHQEHTMSQLRLSGARIIAMMAIVFVLAGLAGCGQPQSNSPSADQTGSTSEAMLKAYRDFGGTIESVNAANPEVTTDVVKLTGMVPAFDLTQGDPPCAGFVQVAPSLVFSLTEAVPTMRISFVGNTISMLIAAAEGAEVFCDEAAPAALKPELTLQQPKVGRYAVWVGRVSLDSDDPTSGKLTVSIAP